MHLDTNSSYREDNDIYLPVYDDINHCGLKTILAFDYVLKNYDLTDFIKSQLNF